MGFETRVPHLSGDHHLKTNHFPYTRTCLSNLASIGAGSRPCVWLHSLKELDGNATDMLTVQFHTLSLFDPHNHPEKY